MDRFYRQQPPNKHSAQMQRDLNDMRLAQRIDRAKADVDNKAPDPLPHLDTRAKYRYLERERQDKIDRDNQILLKRMERHFTTSSGVDCHLIQYGPRTLNKIQRENDLRQVTAENRRLHNAIQNQQPTIIAAKLESDYYKHRRDYHRLCVNYVVLDPPEDYLLPERDSDAKPKRDPPAEPVTDNKEAERGDYQQAEAPAESHEKPEDNVSAGNVKDAIKDDLVEHKGQEEEKPQVDLKAQLKTELEEKPAPNLKDQMQNELAESQKPKGQGLAAQLAQELDTKHKEDDYDGANVYVTYQK